MAGGDNCQLSYVAMDEDDDCLFVDGSGINFLPIAEQSYGDMLHNSMHINKAHVHIMLESVNQSISCYGMCNIVLFSNLYMVH